MHPDPAHGSAGILSPVEFANGSTAWLDSTLSTRVRFAGRELKHTMQTRLSTVDLGVFSERAATCRYGGIGVAIAVTKRAGLANKGTSISAARTLACRSTDVTSALRRTWRSRARCSGSPSTRQPCKEPRFCRATDLGSSDITHLHGNGCERMRREFATPDPACFCRNPAPRSQGCEVARVLPALDTATKDKFPIPGHRNASFM